MDHSSKTPEELIVSCLRGGDESAWVEFVRRFQPLIAGVVLRVARQWGEASPQIIDDLVQETYLKFCADRVRILKNFEFVYENSVYGYIKVFTANLVHDHFKFSHAQKRGGGTVTKPTGQEESGEDGQLSTQIAASPDREVLIHEIDTCLKAILSEPNRERDRRIFWLYYRIGLPASEIAALPATGLNVKGVESTLLRLTRAIRQHLVSSEREGPNREQKGFTPGESL